VGRIPYTELEKTLMCELCKLTNNVKYVSDLTGAHFSTVKRFLDEKGIKLSREYKDMIYHIDISDEELYKRAEAGEEIKDIAADIGINQPYLSGRIARYKNKFNINKTNYSINRSNKLDKIAEEWFKAISDGTKTITQIADKEGMSVSGVSRRIKRYLNRNNKNVDFRLKTGEKI
jgi:DNA-directed RNA polymerase specialized sigma subunit